MVKYPSPRPRPAAVPFLDWRRGPGGYWGLIIGSHTHRLTATSAGKLDEGSKSMTTYTINRIQ